MQTYIIKLVAEGNDLPSSWANVRVGAAMRYYRERCVVEI